MAEATKSRDALPQVKLPRNIRLTVSLWRKAVPFCDSSIPCFLYFRFLHANFFRLLNDVLARALWLTYIKAEKNPEYPNWARWLLKEGEATKQRRELACIDFHPPSFGWEISFSSASKNKFQQHFIADEIFQLVMSVYGFSAETHWDVNENERFSESHPSWALLRIPRYLQLLRYQHRDLRTIATTSNPLEEVCAKVCEGYFGPANLFGRFQIVHIQ